VLSDLGTDSSDRRLRGFGPAVGVPLRSGDEVVGVIVALRVNGREQFRPDELPLLASFADQASIVLELAAKQRAQRQLDIYSDRDRIARDLHDHVIQRLFAAGMNLQGTLLRSREPDVQERLQHTVDQLDQTVKEIRTSIFDLHTPPTEAPRSLRRRLLDIIAEVSDAASVLPSVRISGPIDTVVPIELGHHAEAVVREAVSNAVRHANAAELVIAIDAKESLTIEVTDDGVGIPAGVTHSGLANLAERARRNGGTCQVAPGKDGGTQLLWTVPLSSASPVA
jgi:signal transduction histidine kinase